MRREESGSEMLKKEYRTIKSNDLALSRKNTSRLQLETIDPENKTPRINIYPPLPPSTIIIRVREQQQLRTYVARLRYTIGAFRGGGRGRDVRQD